MTNELTEPVAEVEEPAPSPEEPHYEHDPEMDEWMDAPMGPVEQPGQVEAGERVHELKTWPDYYREVAAGRKRFELRFNDRGFRVGDVLRLREWEPDEGVGYTGRESSYRVTYMLGAEGLAPRKDAPVIMSIDHEPPVPSSGAGVDEAWVNYDMHEWERDRWLEKYPTVGESAWMDEHDRLRAEVEAAIRAPLEEWKRDAT